jgi:hypothetical protein
VLGYARGIVGIEAGWLSDATICASCAVGLSFTEVDSCRALVWAASDVARQKQAAARIDLRVSVVWFMFNLMNPDYRRRQKTNIGSFTDLK